jgi:YggT family protein
MSSIIIGLLYLVVIVFIARALISWFRIGPDSPVWPVANGLYRVTEPVLAPIRRVVPSIGGLDISVLIVVFGIQLIVIPIVAAVL